MSSSTSSQLSFKSPYCFSRLDNGSWYCVICTPVARAYHNSFTTTEGARKHEESAPHLKNLNSGDVKGWWSGAPVADWGNPGERTAWDDWKDDSEWTEGAFAKVRRWLANVESSLDEGGEPRGAGQTKGKGKGAQRSPKANHNDSDVSDLSNEPVKTVDDAIRTEKLRRWTEKFAKNNRYNSEEKQRANNFLQLPTEEKVHQIYNLVKTLRPLLETH